MKRNQAIWHKRVNSLQFRISNGRRNLSATRTLFSYLVREMRKEKGSDEVIADCIEKVTAMLAATDTALTSGSPRELQPHQGNPKEEEADRIEKAHLLHPEPKRPIQDMGQ